MPNTVFCDQCGSEIKPGARFCARCGASVTSDAAPRAAESAIPVQARGAARRLLAIAAATIGVLVAITGGIGYAHYAGLLSLGVVNANLGENEYLYCAGGGEEYFLIDAKGQVVLPFPVGEDPDFVSPVQVEPPYLSIRNGKGVYVNRNGDVLFGTDTASLAGVFREGLAPARDVSKAFQEAFPKNVGFIDFHGTFVIAPQFAEASNFSGGLAAVSPDGERWGYIDKKGAFVIGPRFKRAANFNGDVAEVLDSSGFHLIDRSGNSIGTIRSQNSRLFEADSLETPDAVSEGKWPVAVDGRWGFVDTRGRWAIEPQFSWVGLFREGLAPAALGASGRSEVGFIDHTGKFVIAPHYSGAGEFHRGLAWVVVGGKVGYIDRTGTMVVPPRYENASSFVGELARVFEAGKMRYIDTTGRVVWSEGARDTGVAQGASAKEGAGTSVVDRIATPGAANITEEGIEKILAEIDAAATSRNVDVIYGRLGRNARIDLTVEGLGPLRSMSFSRDEYRAYAQQSFAQVGDYEYRRDNTRIVIGPDGQRAIVTGVVYETASLGGTTLATISTEEATFGIENGQIVITAIKTFTRPQ